MGQAASYVCFPSNVCTKFIMSIISQIFKIFNPRRVGNVRYMKIRHFEC